MTEREMDERDSRQDDAGDAEERTEAGSGDLDTDAVREAKEKLDQAGGGH